MKQLTASAWLVGWTLAAAGCGGGSDAPANVAGVYQIVATLGANGCELPSWTVDQTIPNGIEMTITQDTVDPSKITGRLSGLSVFLLVLALGNDTFVGTIDGTKVDMTLAGRQVVDGACVYSPSATARATANQDSLVMGSISMTYSTNNVAQCGIRNGCNNIIYFSGQRPPGSGAP
jgi:hypothetical protein